MLLIRPAQVGGANLCFPPCWIVVNLFLRSVSAFSPHAFSLRGHGLGCTAFVCQRFKDINSGFKLVSKGFDKYEVIPDHQSPIKLKLVFCQDKIFSLLHCKIAHRYHINMATCLDWHGLVSLLSYCTSSIQFCDTSNVSDLILQCTSSCVDFQALQLISGKQIHDHEIEVPADRSEACVPDQIGTLSQVGTSSYMAYAK